jgi:hypothetical protein
VFVAGEGTRTEGAEHPEPPMTRVRVRRAEMATPPTDTAPRSFDRARFYTIDSQQWPPVTTVLDIIAKPALGPWYRVDRRARSGGGG